jgi:uncharacterized UPF0160 family protein
MSWAGLTGQDLSEVAGIEGAVFCHRGLFIAGNTSKEGAVKMAQKALEVN